MILILVLTQISDTLPVYLPTCSTKLFYASKTAESITSQKFDEFVWWITDSVLNRSINAISTLSNNSKVLSPPSERAKLSAESFSDNSHPRD